MVPILSSSLNLKLYAVYNAHTGLENFGFFYSILFNEIIYYYKIFCC